MQGTKVALVAMAFHLQNTKSSRFFIDICAEHYEDFHVIADVDVWRDIPRLKPDILVIWQRMFSPRELDSFGVKNIVLVPMYDACPHTEEFWKDYRPYKILCFSRTLCDFLSSRGFDALRVQYYMRPPEGKIGKRGERRAFYWERSALVDWPCIRSLIAGARLESLDYHRASNIRERGATEPSPEDAKRLGISFSEWFEDYEAYVETVCRNTIFFAPREAEGIGISFIEAMAWGLAVVAPNAPTMSEYIEDGVTGFLYDPKHPSPLCLDHLDEIRERSLRRAAEGHESWLASIPLIFDFLDRSLDGYRPRIDRWLRIKKRTRADLRSIYKGIKRNKTS